MFTPSLFSSLEETRSRTSRNLRKQIILCTQTRLLIRFGSPNFPLRTSILFFCCSSLCVTLWLFTSIYLDFRFLVFIFVHFASSVFVCLFVCLFAVFYFTCLFCLCFIMSFCIPFSHCQEKKGNRGTILEKLHKGGNHENDENETNKQNKNRQVDILIKIKRNTTTNRQLALGFGRTFDFRHDVTSAPCACFLCPDRSS